MSESRKVVVGRGSECKQMIVVSSLLASFHGSKFFFFVVIEQNAVSFFAANSLIINVKV